MLRFLKLKSGWWGYSLKNILVEERDCLSNDSFKQLICKWHSTDIRAEMVFGQLYIIEYASIRSHKTNRSGTEMPAQREHANMCKRPKSIHSICYSEQIFNRTFWQFEDLIGALRGKIFVQGLYVWHTWCKENVSFPKDSTTLLVSALIDKSFKIQEQTGSHLLTAAG